MRIFFIKTLLINAFILILTACTSPHSHYVKTETDGQIPNNKLASLDCNTATTKVEKMICNDEGIMYLNRLLDAAFMLALDQAEFKNILKNRQKNWVSQVRNVCKDIDCLDRVFRKQINELKEPMNVRPAEMIAIATGQVYSKPIPSSTCDLAKKNPNFDQRIPKGKYLAFYFCDDNFVGSEIVDNISLNYSENEIMNIPPNRFRAVWETNIESKEGHYEVLALNVSWSNVSVYLNQELVSKWSNNNAELPLKLSRGKNKLRIEYRNHWHSVGFTASFSNHVNLNLENANKFIMPLVTPKTKVAYVGAYESGNTYNTAVIKVQKNDNPIILFASSYEAIHWKIDADKKANIKAIIFNSSDPGSTIEIKDKTIPIFKLDGLIYEYENFDKTTTFITKVTGIAPFYKYGKYRLSRVSVPKSEG